MAKKPKSTGDSAAIKDMAGLASLKAQSPGAMQAPAAPFDVDKAPSDDAPGPTEAVELDEDDLGLTQTEPGVVENDDGTATVELDAQDAPEEESDFYANLAKTMAQDELDEIGQRYVKLIEVDIEARKKRDEQQEEGLKRAGLGGPAPGGADFEGASKVTHPVLAESYVDFAASTMKELFPSNGPVRTEILGQVTDEKLDKAQRKRDYMNFQLTREIPEYRGELESLLTQLPAGGSQFMKLYYSTQLKRAVVDFVPIDDFILPYSAKSYQRSQRKFHRMRKSEFEYGQDMEAGLYIDIHVSPMPDSPMNTTKSSTLTAKIEGKDNNYATEDEEYVFYEGSVWDTFTDSKRPKDRMCPYILTLDSDTGKVLSIYRNWDFEKAGKQDKYEEQQYIVKFGFIPWRGAYDIGLPQLIGDLAASLTGALRALLDSAFIQNSQTLIKLKGRPGGESLSISPTQISEIDAVGGDDIRKVMMPLQFNGPSPVLLQLLGYLTSAAKGVVSTSEEKIADAGSQMPVGTAMALIEQGAKVFSAIHARMHDSQRQCLEILHRINRQHIQGKVKFGEDERDYVTQKDFQGPMDVNPVSDPNIFSETQRYAQMQAILSLAEKFPQALSVAKIISRFLQLMKVPDYKDLVNSPPTPKPTNPAAENVGMAMGKPSMPFPEQDHMAHIQVHCDFLKDPMFGMNPMAVKVIAPPMIEHIKQHLLFWYADLMRLEGQTQLGEPVEERAKRDKTWQSDRDISEALAKASGAALAALKQASAQVQPVLQAAMQLLEKVSQPPPPHDPQSLIAAQELQQRAKEHADDHALDQQRLQNTATKQQTDAQIREKSLMVALQKMMAMLQGKKDEVDTDAATTLEQSHIKARTDLIQTAEDNQTALEIASVRGSGSRMTDGSSMDH